MPQYVFNDEPLILRKAKEADPQVFGDALDEIRRRKGGALEPKYVVEAARAPTHPLHPHFEWDDRIAADSFRLEQARGIIRVVRVVDAESDSGSVRAFISVQDRGGIAYRTVDDVKGSADLQERILARAQADLEAFEARYRELQDVCEIVVSAREAIQRRRRGNKKPEARAL